MKKVKNILFCSTRQWNPGDEFIFFGINNILKTSCKFDYNKLLYNRHPGIRTKRFFGNHLVFSLLHHSKKEILKTILNIDTRQVFLDNSWYKSQDGCIDYVIFCGSPEWRGFRVKELFNYILANNIRCSFIGIGGSASELKDYERKVFYENTDLILTRTQKLQNELDSYGAIYDVCPSLFCSQNEQIKTSINKIGLVFQAKGERFAHQVHRNTMGSIIKKYKQILKMYDSKIICHYINDFFEACQNFGKENVLYSSYSEDYEKIYQNFDLIITLRVHGAGIASSLGTPSILIKHDERFETGIMLKSEIVDKDTDLQKIIKTIDIKKKSQELINYKNLKKKNFINFFKKINLSLE